MIIKINSTLKLSDNKIYLVSSTALFDDELYVYLIDTENPQNQKLLKLNLRKNRLVAVTNQKIIEKVMPILLENGMKNLKEFKEN